MLTDCFCPLRLKLRPQAGCTCKKTQKIRKGLRPIATTEVTNAQGRAAMTSFEIQVLRDDLVRSNLITKLSTNKKNGNNK